MNQTTWTAPYVYSGPGLLGFDIAGPLNAPSGQFIGVGGTSITLDSLSDSIADITTNAVGNTDVRMYILEVPTLELIASSDSSTIPVYNISTLSRIVTTKAQDDLVSTTAQFLNASGFPHGQVFVTSGNFLQSRSYTDNYGLDWRIVTIQEVDCDPGFFVGSDNQTW